jgi:hypothetical protein
MVHMVEVPDGAPAGEGFVFWSMMDGPS